jgi:diacylglycerol kinase (ATP)
VILTVAEAVFQTADLLLSVAVCSQEMAVLSSATACAPITSHTTTLGSVPNIATCVIDQTTVMTGQQTPAHDRPANKLAEKLHGLTEKLHSLGHHRTDSDASGRTRTGRAQSS